MFNFADMNTGREDKEQFILGFLKRHEPPKPIPVCPMPKPSDLELARNDLLLTRQHWERINLTNTRTKDPSVIWMPPTVEPPCPGVYRVRYGSGDGHRCDGWKKPLFRIWTGEKWLLGSYLLTNEIEDFYTNGEFWRERTGASKETQQCEWMEVNDEV